MGFEHNRQKKWFVINFCGCAAKAAFVLQVYQFFMKISLYPKYFIRRLSAKDKKSFFSAGYKLLYPEYIRHGMTPWQHYVVDGRRKGYDNGNHPSDKVFFPEGYYLEYPDVRESGQDAWRHYAEFGHKEGRDNGLHPDGGIFFAEGYRAMYPDVAECGEDPWRHYVLHGKAEGRDNGLHPDDDSFFDRGYLAMYADVAQAKADPWRHYVLHGKKEGRDNGNHTDKYIHNAIWGCFSHVDVKVDSARPVSINILMPELARHESAGPLSILYFGRFLLQNGYHVRLLMLSDKSSDVLNENLKYQNDDISEISERFEVEALHIRQEPELRVNDRDMSVATLFNTASIANLIQSRCRKRKFIYFIQDDEREFFPASSLRAAIEQSYAYECYPIFSTEILEQFFLSEDVGGMRSRHARVIWQGCPANYCLPSFEKFSKRSAKKKFVFYARPNNPRNCYWFAFLLLTEAVKRKIFDDSWEFYGIGYPRSCDFRLPGQNVLHMLPKMSLEEYRESLSTYDVALSLMATPHPSMPPVDFALSGCLVVTNTCKNKTEKVLGGISKNIVSAPLLFEPLLNALKKAVSLSGNLELRYQNATGSNWPKSWDAAFGKTHSDWIKDIMESQDE